MTSRSPTRPGEVTAPPRHGPDRALARPATALGALECFATTWLLMMAAMILPAMAPVVATECFPDRTECFPARRLRSLRPIVVTAAFLAGYLAVWAVAGAGLPRAAGRPRPRRRRHPVAPGRAVARRRRARRGRRVPAHDSQANAARAVSGAAQRPRWAADAGGPSLRRGPTYGPGRGASRARGR
jgi:Predicted metal-binding integral membrane protein (DUF2182)